ncbi:hypothetical protein UFOVP1233_34 [uncultured Caudovirales phage]|uniref:Uncharacterized protein n=1 Tax=uncultured Caudovirales phage TaxID=2100421 RepID=A0A6J5RKW2_9CAUD|nr:hypothetical protein UFOVP1233_34 [uncultured Caudovirales phage]
METDPYPTPTLKRQRWLVKSLGWLYASQVAVYICQGIGR